MDTSKKVEYWLSIADDDLNVAKYLLAGEKFLYTGFMCHQTIEKALKAVIAKDCAVNEIPPKIHDLSKLAAKSNLFDIMTETQKDFIDELNPLNLEARYPEYKESLAAGLQKEKCERIIRKTEELLCWIKQQL